METKLMVRLKIGKSNLIIL